MRPVRDVLRAGVRVAVPTRGLGPRLRELTDGVEEDAGLRVLLTEQVSRLEASLVPLLEAGSDHDIREHRDGQG